LHLEGGASLAQPIHDRNDTGRFRESSEVLGEVNTPGRRTFLVRLDDGATSFLLQHEVIMPGEGRDELIQAGLLNSLGSPLAGEAKTLPLTILIVDDETEVADTCARVLTRVGFDCLVAYDSPAALALIDSRQPALVLSDINLATADGFEIARYVQRKTPGTPVILMTAYHNSSAPGQAARAGAAHYLRKPFSNAELTSTVKSLLADPGVSGPC
jgi:CheY-like chemotaxis protein